MYVLRKCSPTPFTWEPPSPKCKQMLLFVAVLGVLVLILNSKGWGLFKRYSITFGVNMIVLIVLIIPQISVFTFWHWILPPRTSALLEGVHCESLIQYRTSRGLWQKAVLLYIVFFQIEYNALFHDRTRTMYSCNTAVVLFSQSMPTGSEVWHLKEGQRLYLIKCWWN